MAVLNKCYFWRFKTFISNAGSKVDNKSVKEGKSVVKPAEPICEGYSFIGWLYEDELYDFCTKVIENITFNAEREEDDKQLQLNVKKYKVY